jgi:hypothetical protein
MIVEKVRQVETRVKYRWLRRGMLQQVLLNHFTVPMVTVDTELFIEPEFRELIPPLRPRSWKASTVMYALFPETSGYELEQIAP